MIKGTNYSKNGKMSPKSSPREIKIFKILENNSQISLMISIRGNSSLMREKHNLILRKKLIENRKQELF